MEQKISHWAEQSMVLHASLTRFRICRHWTAPSVDREQRAESNVLVGGRVIKEKKVAIFYTKAFVVWVNGHIPVPYLHTPIELPGSARVPLELRRTQDGLGVISAKTRVWVTPAQSSIARPTDLQMTNHGSLSYCL